MELNKLILKWIQKSKDPKNRLMGQGHPQKWQSRNYWAPSLFKSS